MEEMGVNAEAKVMVEFIPKTSKPELKKKL
jgi:hypothetical protein